MSRSQALPPRPVDIDAGLPTLEGVSDPCPFCRAYETSSDSVLTRTEVAGALWDSYPCTPGHLLVTPVRHVGRLAELTAQEHQELFSLVGSLVAGELASADGVTVGVNDGPAAGQTIAHVHVHLIPRHVGDVPDPRGGVRMIFPSGAYWD